MTDPEPSSRERATVALAAGDQRTALVLLLELADTEPADPLVLEQLARIHRRMGQPDEAVRLIDAAMASGGSPDLIELRNVCELDAEVRYRTWARFELVGGRFGHAFEAARHAASVRRPTPWTLNIFAEAARLAGRSDEAAKRLGELASVDDRLNDV